MIDFREFGHTAFMHFPLLQLVFSSKKRMKKQGRRRVHTCKNSKHSCLAKLIKTVGDKRNGIVVPNGHLIECSVVYAHSKRAILLLFQKNRCAIR